MEWLWLVQEVLRMLNRHPDPRGFCQWAYQAGVGIYYACS